MKNIFKLLLITSIISLTFTGCDKDDDNSTSSGGDGTFSKGTVTLDFTHIVGSVNLDVTGATNYTNEVGNTFAVNKFRYYISNVKLIKDDESVYDVPNSYFLIDEADQTTVKPELANIPGGKYKGVRFTIGVDSAATEDPSMHVGVLDPANNMFWTWSTGYIFMKLEGTSPNSTSTGNSIIYHIGGYKNSNNTNALREVDLDFGTNLIVNGTREAEVHIMVNLLEFFKGVTPATNIDIATNSVQMAQGGLTLTLADNSKKMFKFDHIHN